MANGDSSKIKRLKEQMKSINNESANIKRELRSEQKKILLSNLKNSRQNLGTLLDVQITLRSVFTFIVIIGFLVGLVFFFNYLSKLSFTSTDSTVDTSSLSLTDIDEAMNETEEVKKVIENQTEKADEALTNITATLKSQDKENDTDEVIPEATPIDEQELITIYKNVKVEFRGDALKVENKGTWSKILAIYYTITNNEKGKIKPTTIHFQEKDDPQPKKVDLPESMIEIGRGESFPLSITLNDVSSIGSFQNNDTDVSYTLTVKDEGGKTIASATKKISVN